MPLRRCPPGVCEQNRGVDVERDVGRVVGEQERRRVDDDEIGDLGTDTRCGFRDGDRVPGVGLRRGTRGETDAGDVRLLQDRLEVLRRAGDVEVAKVRIAWTIEVPVLRGAPEVGVDDQNRHAGLGECRGKVHHRDRLTLGWTRRRDQQRAQRPPPLSAGCRLRDRERDVARVALPHREERRAQRPVRLRGQRRGSAAVATVNRSARFIFTTGISPMTGMRAVGARHVTHARRAAPSAQATRSRPEGRHRHRPGDAARS